LIHAGIDEGHDGPPDPGSPTKRRKPTVSAVSRYPLNRANPEAGSATVAHSDLVGRIAVIGLAAPRVEEIDVGLVAGAGRLRIHLRDEFLVITLSGFAQEQGERFALFVDDVKVSEDEEFRAVVTTGVGDGIAVDVGQVLCV
jgi:hypothetical protein